LDEQLNFLLALQSVDTKIHQLSEAAKAHPMRLAEIEAELLAYQAESDAKQEELDRVEIERKNFEAQIQLQKDQVKKWEGRLTEIKTPREYAALSREIDIARKGMRNQEEEVINLLEQAEALRNEIEQIERASLEKEQGYSGEQTELRGKIESLDSETAMLNKDREAAAAKVDRAVLAQYDRIRVKRAGVALAALLEGGQCSGCRMRIRPQLYQEIVGGRGGINQCPSCMRILYLPKDEESESNLSEAEA